MNEPLLRPMTEADVRELNAQRAELLRLAENCERCTMRGVHVQLYPDCELEFRNRRSER